MIKIATYCRCILMYRKLRWFVWNPNSGYAFRCADPEARRTLLMEAPHFEAL